MTCGESTNSSCLIHFSSASTQLTTIIQQFVSIQSHDSHQSCFQMQHAAVLNKLKSHIVPTGVSEGGL